MPIYLLVKSLVKSFIKKAIEKRSYYSDTYGGKNEACQYVVGLKKSDCFGFQSVMVE